MPPGESRRAEDPTWKRRKSQHSSDLQTINHDDSTPWWSMKFQDKSVDSLYFSCWERKDLCCTALPLPGDSEEGSHKLPPVRFGVHVHAEVHGSLQESR